MKHHFKKICITFALFLGVFPVLTEKGIEINTFVEIKAESGGDGDTWRDLNDRDLYELYEEISNGCACYYGGHADWQQLLTDIGGEISERFHNEIENSEEGSFGEDDNDYGEQDNEYPDREENRDEDPQIEAQLTSIAHNVEEKMKEKYGNDILPFPEVHYKSDYQGRAYAYFDADGKIYVTPSFFELNEAIQESILVHEYTHYFFEHNGQYHVERDADGNILAVKTDDIKVVSAAEIQYYDEQCNKSNDKYLAEMAELGVIVSIDLNTLKEDCMSVVTEPSNYTYVCSNYYRSEIAAREAELQAERDGLFILPNWYREQQENNIIEFWFAVERSVNYEQTHNYNPDGTHN